MKYAIKWHVRHSMGSHQIGSIVASNSEVAMTLARRRWGHAVAVFTHERECVMPPRPDPLPEVEFFGPDFYPTVSDAQYAKDRSWLMNQIARVFS